MKSAGSLSQQSTRAESAANYLPRRETFGSLKKSAEGCRGCELYERATHTVFGAGSVPARLMFIGEVPGDVEDRRGEPFVGPAGRVLDEALAATGLARRDVYVTNAVKHFSWEQRGKRRLHARPKLRHVTACRPWWEAEIRIVRPRVIVCLGALAAQALLGRDFRITRQRGEAIQSEWANCVIGTWHPSAILRAPEEEDRRRMRAELLHDVRFAVRQSGIK